MVFTHRTTNYNSNHTTQTHNGNMKDKQTLTVTESHTHRTHEARNSSKLS